MVDWLFLLIASRFLVFSDGLCYNNAKSSYGTFITGIPRSVIAHRPRYVNHRWLTTCIYPAKCALRISCFFQSHYGGLCYSFTNKIPFTLSLFKAYPHFPQGFPQVFCWLSTPRFTKIPPEFTVKWEYSTNLFQPHFAGFRLVPIAFFDEQEILRYVYKL